MINFPKLTLDFNVKVHQVPQDCQAARVQLDSDSQAWLLPARVFDKKRGVTKNETKKNLNIAIRSQKKITVSQCYSLLCAEFLF